jgi:CDGSH-type Zn-finger protein
MGDAPANRPHVAQKAPCAVDVVAGKTYWWCACGLSKNQPFCDGSHKTTPFVPTRFDAIESKKVWFCGCKQSASAPLCDGTHKTL